MHQQDDILAVRQQGQDHLVAHKGGVGGEIGVAVGERGGGRGAADGGEAHIGEGGAEGVVDGGALPSAGGDDDVGFGGGAISALVGGYGVVVVVRGRLLEGRGCGRGGGRRDGFLLVGLVGRDVQDLAAGVEAGFAEAEALGEHGGHDVEEETGGTDVLH